MVMTKYAWMFTKYGWIALMVISVLAVAVLLILNSSKKSSVKSKKKIKILTAIFLVIALVAGFFSFGYPALKDSQSERKYEDLEDWEKENAKWAYQVQQEINEK